MRLLCLDWIERASDPTQRQHALDQAEAACKGAWEAMCLLEALNDEPERLERIVDLVARLGLEELDVFAIREAAKARSQRLQDDPGATALYEQAADRFEQQRGGSWSLLIEGQHALWPDRPLAGVLERALLDCTNEGTIELAGTLHVVADPPAAEQLLKTVNEADLDAHRIWSLANTWIEIGHADRATQVLDRALLRPLQQRCTILLAFASHDDRAGVRRALTAADEAAETALDWIEVAEAALDAQCSDAIVETRLQRATGAPPQALATAWVTLLGDTTTADRIAPRGARACLRPMVRELPGFDVDADGLFDLLRAAISPDALETIASADYGMGTRKYLQVLQDLVHTGCVPRPLPFGPCEVLSLTRWTSGSNVDHLHRAFACATLLLGDTDANKHVDLFGPLLHSVRALGAPYITATRHYAAWHYRNANKNDTDAQVSAIWTLLLLDPGTHRNTLIQTLDRHGGLKSTPKHLRFTVLPHLWDELKLLVGAAGP